MSEQSLFDTLRLHGVRDLRLHREDRPQAGTGEGLLRIGAIGICASDLHWYCEGAIGEDRLEQAVVPGHEFAGVVDEMAAGGLAAGTRVAEARRKGLTIAMVRRMKHTYPRAIQLVEKVLVDVRSLVTHRFPLSEFQQAFDIAVRREGIKVVLEPWAS